MRFFQILPGTGRGTARRAGEGARPFNQAFARRRARSTMLRMVPLPVPGRN